MVADRSTPGPIRQVPVGAAGAGPYALTTGPDSALWVALKTGAVACIDR